MDIRGSRVGMHCLKKFVQLSIVDIFPEEKHLCRFENRVFVYQPSTE